MDILSIFVDKNANKIKDRIQPVLESFYNEGIDLQERICCVDTLYNLNYSVDIGSIKDYPINDFINIFKFCIANAICEYIMEVEEPNLIEQVISSDYCYFDVKERLDIYRNSINILNEENFDGFISKPGTINTKSRILQNIIDYLDSNNEINLNGFILFRLKDYLLELTETVEKAVEDFLVDKEYNEFIKLLKYFVDIQESKLDKINIVFDESIRFKLYDKHNRLLNEDYISSVEVELGESNINQDDLLISTLITLAPKEIFIHNLSVLKSSKIIQTIKKIFPNKVHCCSRCELCGLKMNIHKE